MEMEIKISEEVLFYLLVVVAVVAILLMVWFGADRSEQRKHQLTLMKQSVEQSLLIQEPRKRR